MNIFTREIKIEITHHFTIIHGEESVEVGYVEENNHNRKEGGEETNNDEEPDLGDVGQGADTDLGCTSS